MAAITTGRDFGAAFCDHFNLPKDQVQCGIEMHVGANELFAATVSIALAADDLAGIAARMGGRLPADLIKIETVDGKARYVQDGPAPVKAQPSPISFDAWMRERTDAAHAAYMARHSMGGQAYPRNAIRELARLFGASVEGIQ